MVEMFIMGSFTGQGVYQEVEGAVDQFTSPTRLSYPRDLDRPETLGDVKLVPWRVTLVTTRDSHLRKVSLGSPLGRRMVGPDEILRLELSRGDLTSVQKNKPLVSWSCVCDETLY